MLYTTYIDVIDNVPKDAIKLIIMRYPPSINILKYDKIYFVKALSPSEDIFNKYKDSNKSIEDWREFVISFNNEIEKREDMLNAIKKVVRLVNSGLDIYMICCEVNGNFCHRTLLAKYMEEKYKIIWGQF